VRVRGERAFWVRDFGAVRVVGAGDVPVSAFVVSASAVSAWPELLLAGTDFGSVALLGLAVTRSNASRTAMDRIPLG
jgi:fructose-1-phosphate kinase PfkB-like protein